jgi:hypothetical protein
VAYFPKVMPLIEGVWGIAGNGGYGAVLGRRSGKSNAEGTSDTCL